MRSWKEEEQITLAMKCHQFRICFDLLLYDCCLFPVAIHFFFWWNSNPFSFQLFEFHIWDIHFKTHQPEFSPSLPPHHCLKHQKSNFQNCPEVLDVQTCWHVLSLLRLHGLIMGGGWPLRFFCGNFHFSLKMMLGGELLRQRFSNFLQL